MNNKKLKNMFCILTFIMLYWEVYSTYTILAVLKWWFYMIPTRSCLRCGPALRLATKCRLLLAGQPIDILPNLMLMLKFFIKLHKNNTKKNNFFFSFLPFLCFPTLKIVMKTKLWGKTHLKCIKFELMNSTERRGGWGCRQHRLLKLEEIAKELEAKLWIEWANEWYEGGGRRVWFSVNNSEINFV